MSDTTTSGKHVNSGQTLNESTARAAPELSRSIPKGKKKAPTPTGVAKSDNKTQSDANTTAPSTLTDVPDLLFNRAGPVRVKQGDDKKAQVTKALSRNSNLIPIPRIPWVRKKPAVNKVGELTKDLHTKLDQDDGVAVNCTYLAQDGRATIDEQSQTWTHLLKLSSLLPFRLIKSTVLTTGPHAHHLALLIRQETAFRFLELPLYIRTKVYNFALKHEGSALSVIMKSGSRKVYAPEYHGSHILALLRACKQIHLEVTPTVYTQAFTFPSTRVACAFLLGIKRNRSLLRSLRSETYTSSSARTMFNLLSEARDLERLSFVHVSSNATPKIAVNTIWKDAGSWLSGSDGDDTEKGLDVLTFDDDAFHVRDKDKKADGFRVTCWGPNEQLEFLEGLRAKMIAEGKKLKKAD